MATKQYDIQTDSRSSRALMSLGECAQDAAVSRRFLENEIARQRLVALRLSSRVLRVRRSEWEKYLDAGATGGAR
jgi:hypothetical protein